MRATLPLHMTPVYNQLQDHSQAHLPDTFRAERTGAIAATEKLCCHIVQKKTDTLNNLKPALNVRPLHSMMTSQQLHHQHLHTNTMQHNFNCPVVTASCKECTYHRARYTPRTFILISLHIITMYSSACYFPKLEHIAHYKAKNQNTVKTNFHTCACSHTHAHTQHNNTHTHTHTHKQHNTTQHNTTQHNTHTHTHTHTQTTQHNTHTHTTVSKIA